MLRSATSAPPAAGLEITGADFDRIRGLLLDLSGIVLADSKRALVVARLGRRLRALGYANFAAYCDHLDNADPSGHERQRLLNCLTTNETRFWREPHHFDFIRDRVVPAWIARAARGGTRRLRVWSAGCSTGEEAYSLAITLREALGTPLRFDLAILATDLDTEVLDIARRGIYPLADLRGQPRQRLAGHFERGRGPNAELVRVRADVRALVAFRPLNLIAPRWPMRGSFDLICCRNVIIYFDPATQEQVCARLLGHLAPGGHLLLGHSESLVGLDHAATRVAQTVYRATGGDI